MSERDRAEESNAMGHRTAQSRNDPGLTARGRTQPEAQGVLTLVCFTCGQEYYFENQDPPEEMSCEKCGGTVFRDFFTPTDGDEAAQDFRDSTERDLDPDDAEGDTRPTDVIDLNRGD